MFSIVLDYKNVINLPWINLNALQIVLWKYTVWWNCFARTLSRVDTRCRAVQNNKRNNAVELVLLTAKKKKKNKTKKKKKKKRRNGEKKKKKKKNKQNKKKKKQNNQNVFFYSIYSCSKPSGLLIRFTNQIYYAFDWRRAAIITRTVRRVGDSNSIVFSLLDSSVGFTSTCKWTGNTKNTWPLMSSLIWLIIIVWTDGRQVINCLLLHSDNTFTHRSVLCVLYIVSWTALKEVYLHTFFRMTEQNLLRSPRARTWANVQRCKKEAGQTHRYTKKTTRS